MSELAALVARAAKEVQKSFRSGISGRASDLLRRPSGFLSTGSYALDRVCSGYVPGGVPILPTGRVVHIYGEWSLGKSLLLDQLFRSVTMPKKSGGLGGIGLCSEAEGTRDPYFAKCIGLDLNLVAMQYPDTLEAMIDMGMEWHENVRKTNPTVPILWGIDSLDATEAEKSAGKGLTESGGWHFGGGKSEALGAGLRKIVKITSRFPTTVVMLNQVRTNVGVMFGDKETTPGGKPPHFYASLEIALRPGGLGLSRKALPQQLSEAMRKKLGLPRKLQGQVTGRWIRAIVTKSKIAPTMNRVADFYIDFYRGVHPVAGLLQTLIMEGVVTIGERGDISYTEPSSGEQHDFGTGKEFMTWIMREGFSTLSPGTAIPKTVKNDRTQPEPEMPKEQQEQESEPASDGE